MPGKSIYFDPHAQGPAVFLGPLESAVMEIVWRLGQAGVKQVLFHLGDRRERAYNTIMTALTRLTDKGLLRRERQGRSFTYVPLQSREAFLRERLGLVRDCLRRHAGAD